MIRNRITPKSNYYLLSSIYYLLPALLLAISSCNSGTWEDDADNWDRAFNVVPPKEIEIKHSYYWRSPHFTLEQGYFFELAYTDSLVKMYLESDDLEKIDSSNNINIRFFGKKPKWFIPGGFQSYDIYRSAEYEHFYLFIDKKKKSIFFTDYQV